MTNDAGHSDTPTAAAQPVIQPRRRLGRIGLAAGGVMLLAAGLLSTGCNHGPAPGKAKLAEVVVTTPITDDVTDYQDFTGRLDALKTVDIRARVSGYVNEVPFKEGDLVKKGDLLFQIDPRTYQADFNQAEANLKQAEADRDLQEKNAVRAKKLIGTGAIAKRKYDQIVASAGKGAGDGRRRAGAARDRAKLYLDYTRVTAPVTGRDQPALSSTPATSSTPTTPC